MRFSDSMYENEFIKMIMYGVVWESIYMELESRYTGENQ